jgi:SOS-response transcriptional repressor LexA
MITHDELLRAMMGKVSAGELRPVDIQNALGLPSSRVSEMLKGRRRIQQDEMPVLARFLGLTGAPQSNVRKIKLIGKVPAGGLRQALDETTDTIDARADLPDEVYALEVDGESMNRIAPFGADVIVDPSDKNLFSGDMYIIGDGEGGFTFKLFKQDPARLVPLSDDPSHEVIPLGAQQIEIIGRVISVSLGAGALRRLSRTLSDA